MLSLKRFAAGSFVLASLLAVPSSAATLLFELSGSRNATFSLPTDPVVPDSVNNQPLLGGSQIFFNNVPGIFNGVATTGNINFGSGPIIAALNISAPGLGFTQFAGTDLFSFIGGQPVFNIGTFNFPGFLGTSSLTISEVEDIGSPAAVPEPTTWLMLVMGFGLVGVTLRSAKTRQQKLAAAL